MALRRSLSLAAYLALARRGANPELAFHTRRPEGTVLWGHGTSADRCVALLQIAARLRGQRPELSFLLTAREGVERPAYLGEQDYWQSLSDDVTSASEKFLDHWKPNLCLWTGGHFRPALLNLAQKRELPTFLIDADEDGLTAAHQRWLPELTRAALGAFGGYMARTGTAAQTLRRLGVPRNEIEVTGPLQQGGAALPCREQERDEVAQVLAGRPVWLAAMARGEELEEIIAAHRQVSRTMLRLLLILVPDDETDGPEFLEVLRNNGLNTAVWSEGDFPDETTQVLLADTWGEMGLWYRLAPVTFMASSLVPGPGGHDPYEPAALGSAILYGPNVKRHLASYRRFVNAGAARIVKDSESLAAALQHCMAPDQAALMAAAGWEVASEGAEVTDKVVDLVHDTLDALGAE